MLMLIGVARVVDYQNQSVLSLSTSPLGFSAISRTIFGRFKLPILGNFRPAPVSKRHHGLVDIDPKFKYTIGAIEFSVLLEILRCVLFSMLKI